MPAFTSLAIAGAAVGSAAASGIAGEQARKTISKASAAASKAIIDAIEKSGITLDEGTKAAIIQMTQSMAEAKAAQEGYMGKAIQAYQSGQGEAAAALMKYAEMALQAQREAYTNAEKAVSTGIEQITGIAAPYNKAGIEALNIMKKVAFSLETSPLYQWQQAEGEKAINRQLAARGLYNSGAGLEDLRRFQTQLGAEETERQYGRVERIAGLGAQFAGQTMGLTASLKGILANAAIQSGQGLANTYMGTGTGLAGLYGQGGQDLANIYSQGGANIGNLLYSGGMNIANLQYGSAAEKARSIREGAYARAGIYQQSGQDRANIGMGTMANINNAIMKGVGLYGSSQGWWTPQTPTTGSSDALWGPGGMLWPS